MLQIPLTLVVVCGWPVCGKSTISRLLAKELGIRCVDIDDVRELAFGQAVDPLESAELADLDRMQMRGSYNLLIAITDENLRLGRSLIVNATFSRKVGFENLQAMLGNHPQARLKVIQCVFGNDTPDEVARRLEQRRATATYLSNVRTFERYAEIKARFEPLEVEHLELDTSAPRTPEECALQALQYIGE